MSLEAEAAQIVSHLAAIHGLTMTVYPNTYPADVVRLQLLHDTFHNTTGSANDLSV